MELIDPHNVAEDFCDGIGDVKTIDDKVRFAAFTRQNSTGIVIRRLVIPIYELPDVIQALAMALAEATRK